MGDAGELSVAVDRLLRGDRIAVGSTNVRISWKGGRPEAVVFNGG